MLCRSPNEEGQALSQQPSLHLPRLHKEAALTKEDFIRQIEIMTERSLRDMVTSPPSPARVKEKPMYPSRHRVKHEPASPLLPMKEEPALPRHNTTASKSDDA